MPLAGKDIISDAKGRIQIRPYEFRMTHLGTSQNHACDIWTGRFQAVNAPYATFARSREKASAGFCQPSVCRGLPFN